MRIVNVDHRNIDDADGFEFESDEFIPIKYVSRREYHSACSYLRFGIDRDNLLEVGYDSMTGDLRDITLLLYKEIADKPMPKIDHTVSAFPVLSSDELESGLTTGFTIIYQKGCLYINLCEIYEHLSAIVYGNVQVVYSQLCGRAMLCGILLNNLDSRCVDFLFGKLKRQHAPR